MTAKRSKTVIVMDSRLKKFAEETNIWKDDVCSIFLKDIDETFWFNTPSELQEFVHVQARERFYDKSMRKGYFDYMNEHGETHRYHIEELMRGEIKKFREEVVALTIVPWTKEDVLNHVKVHWEGEYGSPNDFGWHLIENFDINNILDGNVEKAREEWTAWIDNEQKMFLEDFGYDRYGIIADNWFNCMIEEPIILVIKGGKFEICDGYHRIGLSFKRNVFKIPVILGIQNSNGTDLAILERLNLSISISAYFK